jgi:hypothetical protein
VNVSAKFDIPSSPLATPHRWRHLVLFLRHSHQFQLNAVLRRKRFLKEPLESVLVVRNAGGRGAEGVAEDAASKGHEAQAPQGGAEAERRLKQEVPDGHADGHYQRKQRELHDFWLHSETKVTPGKPPAL